MICLIVMFVLIVVNACGLPGGVGWGDATFMALPEVLGGKGRNREREIGWDLIS